MWLVYAAQCKNCHMDLRASAGQGGSRGAYRFDEERSMTDFYKLAVPAGSTGDQSSTTAMREATAHDQFGPATE
ncbi:hypothetical protein NGR_c03260 [Sinorhizobium fredii NGR234]|uniref:Uncharacterized protein n=1 Tax=Sinorhizobium fredii (strain NBRC 101917 / NGR234) TaxID=394 RepID=C3MGK9_SINFN|nr:hypothetical protein NGR_c03260 [Sinorhizobium fredii NGR234]